MKGKERWKSIPDIQERLKYLYEGLLIQYVEVKDKIVLIDDLSQKIIENMIKRRQQNV